MKRKLYGRSIDRADGKKNNISDLKVLVDKFENSYIVKGYDDGNGNWIEEVDDKTCQFLSIMVLIELYWMYH